jgi:hypothetical protein
LNLTIKKEGLGKCEYVTGIKILHSRLYLFGQLSHFISTDGCAKGYQSGPSEVDDEDLEV